MPPDAQEEEIPDYVRAWADFLHRLYPSASDLPEDEYYALIAIIAPEFGARSLAGVIEYTFQIPYGDALGDVWNVKCDFRLFASSVASVAVKLRAKHFEQWLEEQKQ
jgi:hypothetical protein